MELAEHLLTKMDCNQQRSCLENAIRLCDQVTKGYGLGEPYYTILDNDALNALQKPNIYPERYVALIILFRIIVKQGRDFRVLINPAIFYEFNGKTPPQSETEFCNILDEITRTVSHTQVPLHTTGLSTFKQARTAIKSIEHDLKEIGAALIKIKERDWHIDFQRDSVIIPLSFIARENCPSVNVKYFSEFQTLRFLESAIESKIIHNKKNKSYIRKYLRDEAAIQKSKMLENKKGKITGLGDLSILSLCDMTRQFHNDDNFTIIGVTFDVRLYGILSAHSSIISHSDPILLGEETKESIGRKLGDFYERGQKLTEANKAATDFFREFVDSLREMEWVKGAISSDLKRLFTD